MTSSDKILNLFFKKDADRTSIGTRRSCLLALLDDMKFTNVYPGRYRFVGVATEDIVKIEKIAPGFTRAMQFCSGIDLLARAWYGRVPNSGENGRFFKYSARNFFGFTQTQAEVLWDFRNNLAHSYIGSVRHTAKKKPRKKRSQPCRLEDDGLEPITYDRQNNMWVIHLRSMIKRLENAKELIYLKLSKQSESFKERKSKFVEENLFFYVN